jgi:hypothetical protein
VRDAKNIASWRGLRDVPDKSHSATDITVPTVSPSSVPMQNLTAKIATIDY